MSIGTSNSDADTISTAPIATADDRPGQLSLAAYVGIQV